VGKLRGLEKDLGGELAGGCEDEGGGAGVACPASAATATTAAATTSPTTTTSTTTTSTSTITTSSIASGGGLCV
jgi:hypothetical protein